MTLPSSGPISLLNIRSEFKMTNAQIRSASGKDLNTEIQTVPPVITKTGNTLRGQFDILTKNSYGSVTYSNTSNNNQPVDYSAPINEYYLNGPYVSDLDYPENSNIPTSGQISFSDFYGTVGGDIILVIDSNTENLNLKDAFTAAYPELDPIPWYAKNKKKVIINKGVVVGGTTSNSEKYALKIPADLGGNGLTIINYGDILGYGGPQASNGGNAILAGESTSYGFYSIDNIRTNFTNGIYGVVTAREISSSSYDILSPQTPSGSNSSTVLGTGVLNPGDKISLSGGNITILSREQSSFTAKIVGYNNFSGNIFETPTTSTINQYFLIVTSAITDDSTKPKIGMTISGSGIPGNANAILNIPVYHYGRFSYITPSTNPLFPNSGLIVQRGITSGFRSNSSFRQVGMTLYSDTNPNDILPGTYVSKVETVEGGRLSTMAGSTIVVTTGYIGIIRYGTPEYSIFEVTSEVITSDGNTPNGYIEIGAIVYAADGAAPIGYYYITSQESGIPNKKGIYRCYPAVSSITYRSNVLNVINTYVNKSQTTPIIGIVGERYTTSYFGIVNQTSMSGIRYKLSSSAGAAISTIRKFLTAGGNNDFKFICTTSANVIQNYVKSGDSVLISGSTPVSTFDGTWTISSIVDGTKFDVINNNLVDDTQASASIRVETTPSLSVPVKILNYGRIYAGGGGGAGPFAGPTNYYSITIRNSASGTSKICCDIVLITGPGFEGTGGKGQGYDNQVGNISGTVGLSNPNAQKTCTLKSYNKNYPSTSYDGRIDLLVIPNNTYSALTALSYNSGSTLSAAVPNWKDVYIGSTTQRVEITTQNGATLTPSGGVNYYNLKIGNLYTYGSQNQLFVGSNNASNGSSLNQIVNLYRDPNQSTTGIFYSIVNNIPNTNLNPYNSETRLIVRPFGSTDQYLTWLNSVGGTSGGSGGLYGQNGANKLGKLGGLAGYYIINNTKITWITTGFVAGSVG